MPLATVEKAAKQMAHDKMRALEQERVEAVEQLGVGVGGALVKCLRHGSSGRSRAA